MKEIKIPFSLEEYNKGGYNVKRGNLDARIICTNVDNRNYPIVALIYYDSGEFPGIFSINGEFNIGCQNEDNDLFLVKQEFEDGDIIHFLYDDEENAILNKCEGEYVYTYFCYNDRNWNIGYNKRIVGDFRIATEEEKQKLFDELAKEGKEWNAETKQIEDVKKECTLKPFDKVLVRDYDEDEWNIAFFGYIGKTDSDYYFMTSSGCYTQCIPYNNETKDLLGTTNDLPEKYKNIAL